MSYDFSDSGLEMPDKMMDCHRCGCTQSKGFEVILRENMRTGYKEPETGPEKVHVHMCIRCGYVVPVTNGCSTPEEAAIRWNGDQVVQQNREKEASRRALASN